MANALDGKSILIVEDDPDMLNALVALVNDSGANIETAMDGNEALEVVASFDPDLIVLDAMLPKRSGFLVLEKLKGAHKKKGVRPYIIMVTGNEGRRHQTWAESLGVDGYMNKPFRMEKLMNSITTLLIGDDEIKK
ncbi:MAG: response regulator [Planctomycetota bacterium]